MSRNPNPKSEKLTLTYGEWNGKVFAARINHELDIAVIDPPRVCLKMKSPLWREGAKEWEKSQKAKQEFNDAI
jgi:hypothetical protein